MMDADYDIIERLIRNISHEIKNPLTTIKGYAQLLGLKEGDAAFAEKTRKMVVDNVDLIDERMNALYEVFDLERGTPRKADISGILDTFAASLDEHVSKKVTVRGPAATFEISVDPEQLAGAMSAIAGGFDWENNPDADLEFSAEKAGAAGALVHALFHGVDLSAYGENTFYLPFADKRYFKRGTELFRVFAMSRKNGWRFGLAERDGRQGFVLGV